MNKCYIIALPDEVNNVTKINGIPVLYCGVGKLNASIGMMTLISQGYNNITNIGSCGSVKHKIGEIIKIGKVYQDIDVRPLCKYGVAPNDSDYEIVIDDESTHTCFTTDYFYDSKNLLKYSKKYLKKIKSSSIFDMECYSMAKIAKIHNVKFESFKWVSDDGSFGDWKKNCEIGFDKYLKKLQE
jgi:nucleoside phosphorylase